MITSSRGARSYQAIIQLLALCALLLGALAACGQGATGAGAPQPTATHGPGAGLTILPCVGAYLAGSPAAATLGDAPAVKTASARVGDTIEIHMDIQHVWKLQDVSPPGALTVENRDGLFDRAHSVCVWRFLASAPGATTITLTGRALCDPTQACPQYIINQTYTVDVS